MMTFVFLKEPGCIFKERYPQPWQHDSDLGISLQKHDSLSGRTSLQGDCSKGLCQNVFSTEAPAPKIYFLLLDIHDIESYNVLSLTYHIQVVCFLLPMVNTKGWTTYKEGGFWFEVCRFKTRRENLVKISSKTQDSAEPHTV